MEHWSIPRLWVGVACASRSLVPALHQGNKTNVDKVRKRAVLEGDLPYNQNLMKEQNISKGCLVNNAGVVLCMSWIHWCTIVEKDQEITITHWDSNKKKAIEQFKSFQQLVKYCLCFLMKLLRWKDYTYCIESYQWITFVPIFRVCFCKWRMIWRKAKEVYWYRIQPGFDIYIWSVWILVVSSQF